MKYITNFFYSLAFGLSIVSTINSMDLVDPFPISEEEMEKNLCILHERANFIPTDSPKPDVLHIIPSQDAHTKITYFCPTSEEESNEIIQKICPQYKKIWWFVMPHTKKFNLEQRLEEQGLKPYPLPAMVCGLLGTQFKKPQDATISIKSRYEDAQEWGESQEHLSRNQKMIHFKLFNNEVAASEGTLFFYENWAGILNIKTQEAERRKGFAKLLMNHLLHLAQSHGSQFALLESSPEAYNLYKNLGFKEMLTTYIYYRP